jgi:hypothetical protein
MVDDVLNAPFISLDEQYSLRHSPALTSLARDFPFSFWENKDPDEGSR